MEGRAPCQPVRPGGGAASGVDGLAPALCIAAENAAGPSLVQRGVRAVMNPSIGTGCWLARNRCSHGPAPGRRRRPPRPGAAGTGSRETLREAARKAPGIPVSLLLVCASTAMARACPPVPALLWAVSKPKPQPDGLVIRRLDGQQRGVQFVRVLGLQRAAGQIGLLAGVGVEVPQVVAAEPQVPCP